ncbi:MAG: hypothetical protein QUS11_04420 [Candidatus Fermentibacter sp.]|nr:hypothetical protein [Candidatus Fermentibacter sp.]
MNPSIIIPVLTAELPPAPAIPPGILSGYLIDLAVVIIGVTAAFMLNAWRERHLDRQRERKYFAGFETDIESDLVQLREIVGQESARRDRMASCIASMKDGSQTIEAGMAIMMDVMTIVRFRPNRTTFTSLMNAGHMDSTGDFAFRARLVRLHDEFDSVAEKEEMLREFVSGFAMPFTYRHMNMIGGTFLDAGIVKTPGFINLVLGYSTLLNQNLEAYLVLEGVVTDFRDDVRRRLGRRPASR